MSDGGGLDMACGGLPALRELAAAIGGDPLLVQGAGGNVSIKTGGIMWIKASGTWLADALTSDIMLPLALAGEAVAPHAWCALRPSIETSMHAALRHAVVLHVHHVDTIALAVRPDAAALLAERLAGLRWAFVPYCRPGPSLATAVAALDGSADVLVLGNHGLVAAADTVAAAKALLTEVTGRLAAPARTPPPGNADVLAALVRPHGFRQPADPSAHGLATDPASLAIATAGVLYPDHVVFLGPAPMVVDAHEDVGAALDRWRAGGPTGPSWLIVRGVGVAIAEDLACGGDAMLRCLADVAARVPAGAVVAALPTAEVEALLDWDAERYRQQLARAAA